MAPFELTDAIGVAADPLQDGPERAALRAMVRRVVADVAPTSRVQALDEAETFDDDLYAALREIGVLAIDAVGGAGDVRDQVVVIEELAAGPTSMAAFLILQFMIIQVLGSHASTDEQRGLPGQLLQHGREIEGRATDRLQHGTDRGLLLERDAHLAVALLELVEEA